MTTTIEENLSRYDRFDLKYIFKRESSQQEKFHELLAKLNSISFSDFEANIKPGSTIIRDLFPEMNTNLNFEFDKFSLIIQEDLITLRVKGKSGRRFDPRFIPNFITKTSLTDISKVEVTMNEIKKIDEFLKIHLIQKFFQMQKVIELEEIEIFGLINLKNTFNMNFMNNLINSKIEIPIKLDSIDFSIEEKNNVYGYFIDKGEDRVLMFTHLRDDLDWTVPIHHLLNENLKIMKKHLRELQNE